MSVRRCPFCAEEIQAEAIKCKHCNERLDGASAQVAAPVASLSPSVGTGAKVAPAGTVASPGPDGPRVMLYEGYPSWRAWFGRYALLALAVPALAVLGGYATLDQPTGTKALGIGVPLALGALAFVAMNLFRKSQRVRVSNRNIETETGVLSRRIDILELWRVRDVRYRQSMTDRMLSIAHIQVFTKDVTSPELEIFGMPASKQLFERLRDSVELQRQSNRVLGIMD